MLSKILLLVFGSHNLSQAEKKITVVTSWATHKVTLIFTPNNKFSLRTILCYLIQLLSYFIISFRCKSQQQNFRHHVDHLTRSSENSTLFSYLPRLELVCWFFFDCFYLLERQVFSTKELLAKYLRQYEQLCAVEYNLKI